MDKIMSPAPEWTRTTLAPSGMTKEVLQKTHTRNKYCAEEY
jgi:hypothetical protein